MPHISIAAEKLWTLGGFPITNSILTSWLVTILLFLLSYLVTRKVSLVPSYAQSIAEILVGGIYSLYESVTGKYIKQVFPLLGSIFLYVIIANWVGLLPGVGTIGFFEKTEAGIHETTVASQKENHPLQDGFEKEEANGHNEDNPSSAAVIPESESTPDAHQGKKFVPLFRGATADINTTLALAIVAVIGIQYYGIINFGRFYISRFLSLKDPIQFFLGILEIVSEISKVISFAFRLFGNIFAGEVLLTVIAFLMPYFAPLPFLTLELFVGFIQALVFSMLTAVFLNVAISHGEHEMHLAQLKEGKGKH
jgi:F-type H+-transporting ATPase subunit a